MNKNHIANNILNNLERQKISQEVSERIFRDLLIHNYERFVTLETQQQKIEFCWELKEQALEAAVAWAYDDLDFDEETNEER